MNRKPRVTFSYQKTFDKTLSFFQKRVVTRHRPLNFESFGNMQILG